jgi:hypothetical protein
LFKRHFWRWVHSWVPRASALGVALLAGALGAAPARADFNTGGLMATVGTSTDPQTTGSTVAPGEQITILLTANFLDNKTHLNVRFDVDVPEGLDFVGWSVSARSQPSVIGFIPFGLPDADPSPFNNTTADGDGKDVTLLVASVINPDDDPNDSANDFVVFALTFVARTSARGTMPLLFDFSDATVGGLGSAGVDLTAGEATLEITKTSQSSPTIARALELTVNVKHAGSALSPYAYDTTVKDLVDTTVFDLSDLTPLSVPAGYSVTAKSGKPSAGLGTITFDPKTAPSLAPGDELEFTYTLRLRDGQTAPSTLPYPALVRANTIDTPFPQGFSGKLVEASDAAALDDDDQDGLTTIEEQLIGSDTLDADTDDDGVADGDETAGDEDIDGDGLVGVLDPDSDGDGLFDGLELGVTDPVADGTGFSGTNDGAGFFVADADATTTTSDILDDTDGDGLSDGVEDANQDGAVDVGELDPNDPTDAVQDLSGMTDSDFDGMPDHLEVLLGRDPAVTGTATVPPPDTDGDGVPDEVETFFGTNPNVPDLDSDDDGIRDDTEPAGFRDVDGDGLVGFLDPDSDGDGILDGTEFGVDMPTADTDLSVFVADMDSTTTTSVVAADTDGDGLPDGWEDLDQDGEVDPGELDPNDPDDAFDLIDTDGDGIPDTALATDNDGDGVVDSVDPGDTDGDGVPDGGELVDTDRDGLPDVVEDARGIDPRDADVDDDGVADGAEIFPFEDTDGDGLVNVLDADADNDGLLDGTELGVTEEVADPDGDDGDLAGTDTSRGSFRVDDDPTTTTKPHIADTDGDGLLDGIEDLNRDGVYAVGEELDPNDPDDAFDPIDTDGDGVADTSLATGDDGDGVAQPAELVDADGDGLPDAAETAAGLDPEDQDTDDDGVADADEPGALIDVDGDGLIGALDYDSDDDGLTDGVEAGVTVTADITVDTDTDAAWFRFAVAPATVTNPLSGDTDGDGLLDSYEDLNRDGTIDAGELDPTDPDDAFDLVDTTGDGSPDTPFAIDADGDGVVDPDELVDSDGDGIPDVVEIALGLNPVALDADNDGVADGDELDPFVDTDLDGLINMLDPDSDNDGLSDGLELGVTAGVPSTVINGTTIIGTDTSSPNFQADQHPRSTTDPLDPDTDGDGKLDGEEDANRNGRVDRGETNPNRFDTGTSETGSARSGADCAFAGPGARPGGWVFLLAGAALGLVRRRVRRRSLLPQRTQRSQRRGARRSSPWPLCSLWLSLLFLIALAAAPPVEAKNQGDDGFSARRYWTQIDGLGLGPLESPEVLDKGSFYLGLFYDHTDNAVELEGRKSGDRLGDLVPNLDTLELGLGYGLPADLSVGLQVPLTIYTKAFKFSDGDRIRGEGFGDMRMAFKWNPWTNRERDLTLGFELGITFPTGNQSRFWGDGDAKANLTVRTEYRAWDRVRFLGELGYEWLDGSVRAAGITVDDRVRFGVGVAVMLYRSPSFPRVKRRTRDARELALGDKPPPPPDPKPAWRFDLELALDGEFRASHPTKMETFPIDLYTAARLDTPMDLSVHLGLGFGLTEGIGAVESRVFFGLGLTVGPNPRNRWQMGRPPE